MTGERHFVRRCAVLVAASLLLAPAAKASNDEDAEGPYIRGRKKRAEWKYAFPVAGPDVFFDDYHLNYPATDLTGCRQTVRAPISGLIVDVRKIDNWDPAVDDPGTRGGLTITMHGDDFVRYYFSHLGRLMVKRGQRVESGQKIATVGQSGNARTTLCHLHFGISRICPQSEQNLRRGEIWPAKYLRAWQRGEQLSPNEEMRALVRRTPSACILAAAAQRRGGDQ